MNTGIWECSAGSFSVLDRQNTESVIILQGGCTLTDLDCGGSGERGGGLVLGVGDSAVLEKGSSVEWSIPEGGCKKFYVIC